MIRIFSILSIFIAASFLVSCKSNTSRLSHKWQINFVGYYPSQPLDMTDTENVKLVTDYKTAYSGNIYDIKSDGTFSLVVGDSNRKGTWTESDGIVTFKYPGSKGEEQEDWEFPKGEGIKIYADSSLQTKIMLGGGDYLDIQLKPAKGEKVSPDY